ncbi:MAG: lytic transglycosylase domain-containing protein [Bacteroidota bacterium]
MRPGIIHMIMLIIILSASGSSDILWAQQNTLPETSIDSINRQAETQASRYGFQSLFSQQQFNTNFPFNHSIHPEAWGFIQDYLQKQKKNLTQMKGWALPYFNLIENIMSQYNLPKELKYLAVIESGLSTHAISWAGARGPWQLMPETARQYGLEVNRWTDERTDYFRSTHAAAKLLSVLYNDLQDWLLVIAAYNGGRGRVDAAIKKSGSKNFWKLQYFLPEESRMHVKKFIATHYIMEDKKKPDLSTDTYLTTKNKIDTIEAGMSVQEIAGKFNSAVMAKHLLLDLNYFNFLNPGLDQKLGENKTFLLKLPTEKMEIFNANRYTILSESIHLLLRFYGNEEHTN